MSLLFAAFYGCWRLLAPWIHGAVPPPDLSRIDAWIRPCLQGREGWEVPVFPALFCLYLAAAAWIANWGEGSLLRNGWVQLAACAPAFAIALFTRSGIVFPIPGGDLRGYLVSAGGTGLILAGVWLFCREPRGATLLSRLPSLAGWMCLALFTVLASSPAFVYDYGFVMGPAGHLLQGEAWDSFYQQYGLAQTLFFAAMMKAGLSVQGMQIGVAGLFAVWLFCFRGLARALIADPMLRRLFVATVILVRFAAFRTYPFNFPQTSVARLELWAPLALCWARFGPASPLTAWAFGAAYLGDSQFGALLCGAYIAAVLAGMAWKHPAFAGLGPRRVAALVFPGALACAFHVAVFHSPVSTAGKLYFSLRIDMLPIEAHSLFWPLAWLLAACLAACLRKRQPLELFLFPVLVIQLMYFFGRSHENNLLNVAGIILLILFVGLDRVAEIKASAAISRRVAWALILATTVVFGGGIRGRFGRMAANLSADRWTERSPEEALADGLEKFVAAHSDRHILWVSPFDAYLNYRFGVPAVGFWSPFAAHIDVDETSGFLKERLGAGDLAVLVGWDSAFAVPPLAASAVWSRAHVRLETRRLDGWTVLEYTSGPGSVPDSGL